MFTRLQGLRHRVPGADRASGDLGAALWVCAAVAFAFRAAAVRHVSYFAQDFAVIVGAADNVLHHRPLYSADSDLLPFLYPPPSAIAVTPFAALSLHAAEQLALVLGLVALVITALVSARLAVRAGAATLHTSGLALLLVALWQPSYDALSNVNSTLVLAPVVPVFLLLTLNRRHLTAAVLLGLSLALKPLLLPLIVVPLLYARPRAALLSLAIPVVSTLVSLPFIADGGQFFSDVVPRLISGDAGRLGENNMSLANLHELAGVDPGVSLAVRAVVVLASVALAVAIWRSRTNETLRLVEMTGVLLVGFLSAGGTNESHYQLALAPLVVSMLVARSHLRSVLGGLGVFLFAYGGPVIFVTTSETGSKSLWRAAGLVLVLMAVAVSLNRERRERRATSPRPEPPEHPAAAIPT